MLAVTVNVLWLPLIVLCSAFFGYIFRKAAVIKSQKRVLSLENEMLANHAEILKLQQELATIQRAKAAQSSTPVVPMKDSNSDESQKNVR
jgi:hypothetical protein